MPHPSIAGSALSGVQRSLQKQWKRYRKELKRCQKKFSEKSVHESRVAARRLWATIELLERFLPAERLRTVRHRIKEHLDVFDDLRDTQVQLAAVTSLQPTFPAARLFCAWLKKREARFRKRTREQIKGINTRPLANSIEASQQEFAKRLKRMYGKGGRLLLRAVDRAFGRTAQLRARNRVDRPKTIHRTRVAFKRFRYMVELLADGLGADEKLLTEMQHYQTMMGDIQDAVVLLESFDKFVRKKKLRTEPVTRLREELARRRAWLIKVYMDGAGQLRDFWPVANEVKKVR